MISITTKEKLILSAPVIILIPLTLMLTPLKEIIPWPSCPVHSLTGIYCPGCGATRSLMAMSDGNFLLAFRQNPLVIFTIFYLTFLWVKIFKTKIISLKRKPSAEEVEKDLIKEKAYPKLILAFLILLIIYTVLRNFIEILAPIPI